MQPNQQPQQPQYIPRFAKSNDCNGVIELRYHPQMKNKDNSPLLIGSVIHLKEQIEQTIAKNTQQFEALKKHLTRLVDMADGKVANDPPLGINKKPLKAIKQKKEKKHATVK